MKPWQLVFGATAVFAGLLVAAFFTPEVGDGHGFAHPLIQGMQRGGPSSRHDAVLWLGWALGGTLVVLFVSLLALGAGSRAGLRGLGWPLALGGLLYAASWTALVVSYTGYAAGSAATFAGFPLPTAWMLFALWPVPLFFVALYAFGFDHWIATPEDLAELERRLAEQRGPSGPEAPGSR